LRSDIFALFNSFVPTGRKPAFSPAIQCRSLDVPSIDFAEVAIDSESGLPIARLCGSASGPFAPSRLESAGTATNSTPALNASLCHHAKMKHDRKVTAQRNE